MQYLHTMVRVADLDAALDFYCAKLGLAGGPQCWTLFSTQEYGRANKVPQVGSSAGATSICGPRMPATSRQECHRGSNTGCMPAHDCLAAT